ncbi:hypothetical protein DFH09DRAFT_1274799 [Mycena vulgaris]|nr:hypothetical protein DFH09DRAFT_1274799 [Mycena vulgaris]
MQKRRRICENQAVIKDLVVDLRRAFTKMGILIISSKVVREEKKLRVSTVTRCHSSNLLSPSRPLPSRIRRMDANSTLRPFGDDLGGFLTTRHALTAQSAFTARQTPYTRHDEALLAAIDPAAKYDDMTRLDTSYHSGPSHVEPRASMSDSGEELFPSSTCLKWKSRVKLSALPTPYTRNKKQDEKKNTALDGDLKDEEEEKGLAVLPLGDFLDALTQQDDNDSESKHSFLDSNVCPSFSGSMTAALNEATLAQIIKAPTHGRRLTSSAPLRSGRERSSPATPARPTRSSLLLRPSRGTTHVPAIAPLPSATTPLHLAFASAAPSSPSPHAHPARRPFSLPVRRRYLRACASASAARRRGVRSAAGAGREACAPSRGGGRGRDGALDIDCGSGLSYAHPSSGEEESFFWSSLCFPPSPPLPSSTFLALGPYLPPFTFRALGPTSPPFALVLVSLPAHPRRTPRRSCVHSAHPHPPLPPVSERRMVCCAISGYPRYLGVFSRCIGCSELPSVVGRGSSCARRGSADVERGEGAAVLVCDACARAGRRAASVGVGSTGGARWAALAAARARRENGGIWARRRQSRAGCTALRGEGYVGRVVFAGAGMCAGDACGAAPGERVERGRGLTIREWAARRRGGARCVQPLALLFLIPSPLPSFLSFPSFIRLPFLFIPSPLLPRSLLEPTPALSSSPRASAVRGVLRGSSPGDRAAASSVFPSAHAGCAVRACPGIVDTPPCPRAHASVLGDARAAAGYGAVWCSRAMSLTWVGEREPAGRREAPSLRRSDSFTPFVRRIIIVWSQHRKFKDEIAQSTLKSQADVPSLIPAEWLQNSLRLLADHIIDALAKQNHTHTLLPSRRREPQRYFVNILCRGFFFLSHYRLVPHRAHLRL